MDSELLYLKKRANFHRRMARQATCGEARCAHDALLRAYLERIEKQSGGGRSDRAEGSSAGSPSRQLLLIGAMREPAG